MTFPTQRNLILFAAGGSAAMMLGALAFQHLGDMAPCKLCLWQRWPHVIAIGFGVLALLVAPRVIAFGGMVAALTTAGIGFYHTGVERGWWEGPTTCTVGDTASLSTDELLAQIMSAPLVRCDEVPWEMFTLSMASWNAIVSLGLAGVWFLAWRRG